MKYFLPILALLALTPFLSRSQGRGGEAVVFGGRNGAATRSIATRFSAGDKLGVLAYELNGLGEWNASVRPNFMYNVALESTSLGFMYSPQKYYPANGDKVQFFAYSPYNAPGVTLSLSTSADYPTLSFECPATADVDLLAAVTEPQNTGSVYLRCDHLLSRVNFSMRADAKYSADTSPSVVLDRVQIDIPRRGTFRFADYVRSPASAASWWTVGVETVSITRELNLEIVNAQSGQWTALLTEPLLALPGAVAVTVYFTRGASSFSETFTIASGVLTAGGNVNFQMTLAYKAGDDGEGDIDPPPDF